MVARGEESSRKKSEKGEGGNKRYRFPVIKSTSHGDVMYSFSNRE